MGGWRGVRLGLFSPAGTRHRRAGGAGSDEVRETDDDHRGGGLSGALCGSPDGVEAVRTGQIPAVRVGRRWVVPVAPLAKQLGLTEAGLLHGSMRTPQRERRPHPRAGRRSALLSAAYALAREVTGAEELLAGVPSNATGSPRPLARIGEAPDGPPLALTYELARRVEANRETKPLQELVQGSRPTTSPRSREPRKKRRRLRWARCPPTPRKFSPWPPVSSSRWADAGSSTGAARRVGAGGARDRRRAGVGDPGHAGPG